jgi:hypothetical protein
MVGNGSRGGWEEGKRNDMIAGAKCNREETRRLTSSHSPLFADATRDACSPSMTPTPEMGNWNASHMMAH